MSNEVCHVHFVDHNRVARVQQRMSPVEAVQELAQTFKVLGDPARIRILQALAIEELCVCDIASLLGMSQSAVSHQLRLLRNCKLVKWRREGKMAYYHLDDDHVRSLITEGLNHVIHG